MATFIDTQPDKIKQTHTGQYLFYFTGGENLLTLPVGARYAIVYEPTIYSLKGQAIEYEIVPGQEVETWSKVVNERELTAEEINHFERLIEAE